ncbi:hypothetical protein, partial [Phormidium sp. CCY1219]|uniref:hypothetical protein n=1 Tax=Phormidium sp. CCY1219 TaxID=2886104 RepID=UPI002D1E4F52
MVDFTEGGDDFPCPCCGVTLQFYARWGKRECPRCGWKASLFQTTEQTIEPSEAMHLHYSGGGGLSKAAVQVTCSHCHTAVVFEPPTVLTQCPCCRSAIATPPQTPSPGVCPTGIVPFALDAETATACIQRWIAKLPVSLTPRVKLSQLQRLQGVYLPFWIFDAYTIAQYRGDRADYQAIAQTHTEINDWGEAERKTRYIRRKQWSGRSGQVSRFFDEVPIAATPFIPPHQLENLEFSRLLESWRPYDPAYLQGYVTLASRLLPQAALETAKDLMASTLHADAIRQMGGDEQRLEHLSLRYPALSFKQVLLPVWLGTYRDRHQVYRVLVNGRTGAIVGDVPNHSLKLTDTFNPEKSSNCWKFLSMAQSGMKL